MLIDTNKIPRYESLGKQEDEFDPIVVERLYNPITSEEWLITHFDVSENTITCFYYSPLIRGEFIDVDLSLLEKLSKDEIYGIYRDDEFIEKPFLKCKPLFEDALNDRIKELQAKQLAQETGDFAIEDLSEPQIKRKNKKKSKSKNNKLRVKDKDFGFEL